MRILLAHNSLYFPSHGGGDKSNRLLMEALAERGHSVRVVSRVERFGPEEHRKLIRALEERGVSSKTTSEGVVCFERIGVDVHTVALQPNIRGYFQTQIEKFDPDVIITSTDDPGQLLFDLAVRATRARVVYLVRATIAVPFGPDSSSPNPAKADLLKHADGIVGVSEYVAGYMREFGGVEAIHVPISLLDKGAEYPYAASFDSPYVSMVNPCAVKGISIFLGLADRLPHVKFAAVPTWGTNEEDAAELRRRNNVTVLPPVDNIDELLRITRVMLVPSIWAEARSRIVVEAMSRGVPVVSSNAGGIPEAHLGVDYMLPVNVIRHYKAAVDANMVPVAEVPPQDLAPWEAAIERLTSEREHWEELSRQSYAAAVEYARNLNVLPFEVFLEELRQKPRKAAPTAALSDEKRKLLALRMKQKASTAKAHPVLAGVEELGSTERALFCFPWAGGGTVAYRSWRHSMRGIVAIRLPGRESRSSEPPEDSMETLVPKLAETFAPYLTGRSFAFFGHSMGAGIAFEVARHLRRAGLPLPSALVVSAARAPQYRLNLQPGPDPSDEELLEQLQRLQGLPRDVLQSREMLQMLLPVLRADTRLYRQYVYVPDEPLSIPIFAYGGSDDPNVRPEHLEAWREQTSTEFLRREFQGGHFYLHTQQTELIRALGEDLRQE